MRCHFSNIRSIKICFVIITRAGGKPENPTSPRTGDKTMINYNTLQNTLAIFTEILKLQISNPAKHF